MSDLSTNMVSYTLDSNTLFLILFSEINPLIHFQGTLLLGVLLAR